MPQGSIVTFGEFRKTIGDGSHDLDNDVFKIMLVTNGVVPTASTATPDSADFTEVTGTNYVAGGETVTVTWTEVGGVSTFATTNSAAWVQDPTAPNNIYYGILYNSSHVGTTDAVAFVDMTADAGVTPVSLIDGNITIGAATVFTVT